MRDGHIFQAVGGKAAKEAFEVGQRFLQAGLGQSQRVRFDSRVELDGYIPGVFPDDLGLPSCFLGDVDLDVPLKRGEAGKPISFGTLCLAYAF
jgi:hypothetical protein